MELLRKTSGICRGAARHIIKGVNSTTPSVIIGKGVGIVYGGLRPMTSGQTSLSAHWEAHTSSQQDVKRWWRVAPPNDVIKRARLSNYFSSREDNDEGSRNETPSK